MAALTRRTWAQLATEATRRLKGIDYSGFDSRVQYWLWNAYLWLCTTYGHFELDKTVSGTLGTTNNQIDLASVATDAWIIMSLEIKNVSTSKPIANLVQKDAHALFAAYRAVSEQPVAFTRFGTKLYLNSIPNAAYPYDLYYRRLPTAPDFAGSATPELPADTDEALLAAAVSLASAQLSMDPSGAQGVLQWWQAGQVRPVLSESDQPDRPLLPRANQTHQGGQG